MDRRGPRRRSHGFRVLNDRSKAAGARRRHVPYRPGRQDILDREGGRRGGHGGRGTRPRDLARSESYLFGGQRTSRERSFACVDVVSPPSHILLVVALQLVLQTLRRIIVEISVAGYPGTILKRARRLRHRRTRSRRITRIGTLYHVTGIVTRDRNFHRYNEIYTCIISSLSIVSLQKMYITRGRTFLNIRCTLSFVSIRKTCFNCMEQNTTLPRAKRSFYSVL